MPRLSRFSVSSRGIGYSYRLRTCVNVQAYFFFSWGMRDAIRIDVIDRSATNLPPGIKSARVANNQKGRPMIHASEPENDHQEPKKDNHLPLDLNQNLAGRTFYASRKPDSASIDPHWKNRVDPTIIEIYEAEQELAIGAIIRFHDQAPAAGSINGFSVRSTLTVLPAQTGIVVLEKLPEIASYPGVMRITYDYPGEPA